jgi:4-amino-4-deoxy-L-arabinose transferase-like glycosyltransferase
MRVVFPSHEAPSPQPSPRRGEGDDLFLTPAPKKRQGFFLPRPSGERVPVGRVRGRAIASTAALHCGSAEKLDHAHFFDGAGWRKYGLLAILLLATFLVRALHAGQPVVENYVGRQVPTAMVARNLDRGKGFLRPQLDTAPFPNYFVVEPPIYESGVVILARLTNLSLPEAGRILSALATAAAALGLFALTRRREGAVVAYLAVAAFAVFPLTIRYGRAFQPDAAMMGAVVLGLACWSQHRPGGRWYWLPAAWCLVALGLAIKITAAFLLVPLVLVIERARSLRAILVVCSTLLPAVLWYAWAAHLLGSGEGSRASADNRSIWLGLVGPSSLLKPETLKFVGWFLFVRAFTPLGAGMALFGLAYRGTSHANRDALWLAWGISALAAMAILAEKLHHEYYWLLVAPIAAVGIGRCLAWLARFHRGVAVAVAGSLLVLSCAQVRSTWRTPAEWNGLEQAAGAVAATVPADAWVVAPEALLFQADRRGCRMEWSAAAAARAAGEWQAGRRVDGPLELVEFYRRQGARYFADLGCRKAYLTREGLHDAVRRRYKVIVDLPDVIIADLADCETHWNAN